jgi:hypothetical protein
MDFPVVQFDSVIHVGAPVLLSSPPAFKGSHEGRLLSVSNQPERWVFGVGISGTWSVLSSKSGSLRFVDFDSTLKLYRREIIESAATLGLIYPTTVLTPYAESEFGPYSILHGTPYSARGVGSECWASTKKLSLFWRVTQCRLAPGSSSLPSSPFSQRIHLTFMVFGGSTFTTLKNLLISQLLAVVFIKTAFLS